MLKQKTIIMGLRVYEDDKKEFQRICSELRIDSGGKITEAIVFREMLNWLKKNKSRIKENYTTVCV